jgi:hypothetical protein
MRTISPQLKRRTGRGILAGRIVGQKIFKIPSSAHSTGDHLSDMPNSRVLCLEKNAAPAWRYLPVAECVQLRPVSCFQLTRRFDSSVTRRYLGAGESTNES